MTEIERIQDAIRRLHTVEAKHVETVAVKDSVADQTVWDGTVEVFDIEGHALANRLYAWVRRIEHGKKQLITVLHLYPIDSAHDAVKAFIVRENRLAKEQDSEAVIFQVTRLRKLETDRLN